MCHAYIDPKLLLRDAEDTYSAAQTATVSGAEPLDTTIPPHLIPGWRGVWARIKALLPRRLWRSIGHRPATIPAE